MRGTGELGVNLVEIRCVIGGNVEPSAIRIQRPDEPLNPQFVVKNPAFVLPLLRPGIWEIDMIRLDRIAWDIPVYKVGGIAPNDEYPCGVMLQQPLRGVANVFWGAFYSDEVGFTVSV